MQAAVVGWRRPCRHAEPATVGHGVARIGAQVENGAFQLHAVDPGGRQGRLQVEMKRNPLPQGVGKHVGHAFDQGVDIGRRRLKRLLAAKGQKALGQDGRLARRVKRRIDMDLHRRPRPGATAARHVEIADDDMQEVVEIVRYAADQFAHGFQAGEAGDRRLGLGALGHFVAQPVVARGELRRPCLDTAFQVVHQRLALAFRPLQALYQAFQTIEQDDDRRPDGDISQGQPRRGQGRRRRRMYKGHPRHDHRKDHAQQGRPAPQGVGADHDGRHQGDKGRTGDRKADQQAQAQRDRRHPNGRRIARSRMCRQSVLHGAKNARH